MSPHVLFMYCAKHTPLNSGYLQDLFLSFSDIFISVNCSIHNEAPELWKNLHKIGGFDRNSGLVWLWFM